ncbi:MAG: NAD-dependent epimerase/dehydratase family protein [Leptospirillia bacterium]
MKLLITGGAGFLGSNLGADALARGDALLIYDNLSRVGAGSNLEWLSEQGKYRFIQGNTHDARAMADAVAGFVPDAVFHLAGQVAMTTSIADPRSDFNTNALGTLNLLEAVRAHAPEATVVYSSTNKVYGDLEQFQYRETATRYECVEQPDGFDESCPLEFHSPYGCSKGAADQYMLDYARIFGMKTVVFRHSSMYGGRQFATADQGWIGWFCQKGVDVKRGTSDAPFTISGSGKQVRDVLHAEDMKRLYAAAVTHIDRARGEAFNIGGGMANSLSLLELFALIEELLGITLEYTKLPPRESDQRVFVANLAKARRLLDWQPRVGTREGIAAMLEWTENITEAAGSSREGTA